MFAKNYRVPVIMFHSVGVAHINWPYQFLSEDIDSFVRKIDYLIDSGHHFIFHDDLFRYMKDGKLIPDRSIMITFDDGFLDNWVIVYPLLKKRNVKFTIYVSQEFVDQSSSCRPTLEDVWADNVEKSDLKVLGYLSWEEMKIMQKSGLVDIQSHTSTHTWHFVSDTIIDFFHPGNTQQFPWLKWNHFPELKSKWMFEDKENELFGLPIYENTRAMVANRYIENEFLNKKLSTFIRENGGRHFFSKNDWRNELLSIVRKNCNISSNRKVFETETDRTNRLRYELLYNKRAIEASLDKEVRYLCWPGGAYDSKLIDLAEKCGYWATTVKAGKNTIGDDARFVNRISSGNPTGAHQFPWKYKLFTLKFYLDRFQGKPWANVLDRLYRYRK